MYEYYVHMSTDHGSTARIRDVIFDHALALLHTPTGTSADVAVGDHMTFHMPLCAGSAHLELGGGA